MPYPTLTELKNRLRWLNTSLEKSELDYNDDFNLEIPFASFSDYSGGLAERVNSHILERDFSFVTLDGSGMGTCYTVIRSCHVFDAITSEDFSEFMEQVDSLADYPCLDDELYSKWETELISESITENMGEFFRELKALHETEWDERGEAGSEPEKTDCLDNALDWVEFENMKKWVYDLLETEKYHPTIENGNSAYIDFEILAQNVTYKILLSVIDGSYFVVPDAEQLTLIKELI